MLYPPFALKIFSACACKALISLVYSKYEFFAFSIDPKLGLPPIIMSWVYPFTKEPGKQRIKAICRVLFLL